MKTWKAVLILNNNLTNFTKILIQAQISSSYIIEINEVNNCDKLNAHQMIQFITATIFFPHCKKKDHNATCCINLGHDGDANIPSKVLLREN